MNVMTSITMLFPVSSEIPALPLVIIFVIVFLICSLRSCCGLVILRRLLGLRRIKEKNGNGRGDPDFMTIIAGVRRPNNGEAQLPLLRQELDEVKNASTICISDPTITMPTDGPVSPPPLNNPMTVEYLKKHLNPTTPRMILNNKVKENFLKKLASDAVLQNLRQALKLNVTKIQTLPLLEHTLIGKRLFKVSAEMMYRMNVLCIYYYCNMNETHNDNNNNDASLGSSSQKQLLDRINQEILAVCGFCDWNPQNHYLDTAMMSMGVSLAIDWVGHDLPESTVATAKSNLVHKGIIPSYTKKQFWMQAANNWNQVCHGSMIAASVAIADVHPELAAQTIHRALDCLPHALAQYGPDGVYPEGPSYWSFGTSYTTLASSILETAFGTDFGIADYPAFQASAMFRVMTSNAPSGMLYNFSDGFDHRPVDGDLLLAWFASKSGNPLFYERTRFLRDYRKMHKLDSIVGAGMIWLSQFEEASGNSNQTPTSWKGEGCNPVVVFTAHRDGDDSQYYFGGKGGKGENSHGNIDGGSFVFEMDGVRWVLDPGGQSYDPLEKAGIDLWNLKQDSTRWTLLTKYNYSHSTLTVNGELHRVNGMSSLVNFVGGENPSAELDLTPAFGGLLKSSHRRFTRDSNTSLLIEDELKLSDKAESITWQLVTTAAVSLEDFGATLKQDNKVLKLELLSEPKVGISVIELDPPPLALDRRIGGLKRIELRFPAYLFEGGKGKIRVRLSRGSAKVGDSIFTSRE